MIRVMGSGFGCSLRWQRWLKEEETRNRIKPCFFYLTCPEDVGIYCVCPSCVILCLKRENVYSWAARIETCVPVIHHKKFNYHCQVFPLSSILLLCGGITRKKKKSQLINSFDPHCTHVSQHLLESHKTCQHPTQKKKNHSRFFWHFNPLNVSLCFPAPPR